MKRVKEVSIYDLMSWDNSVNINIESLLNIWNNSDFTAWLGNDGYVYITDRKVEPKNDYIFKCEKETAIKYIHELFKEMGIYDDYDYDNDNNNRNRIDEEIFYNILDYINEILEN